MGGVLLAASGCDQSNNPDKVASSFVDAYYVEFDLERAKGLAQGGAVGRLDRELELVLETRKKVQVQAAKARVYYTDPEIHRVGEDMVHYTYHLDIRKGPTKLKRTAIVMLARRKGRWVVLQFREETPGAIRHPGAEFGSEVRTGTVGPNTVGLSRTSTTP